MYNPPLELDIIEEIELGERSLAQVVKAIPTAYERADRAVLNLQRIIIEEIPPEYTITGANG